MSAWLSLRRGRGSPGLYSSGLAVHREEIAGRGGEETLAVRLPGPPTLDVSFSHSIRRGVPRLCLINRVAYFCDRHRRNAAYLPRDFAKEPAQNWPPLTG